MRIDGSQKLPPRPGSTDGNKFSLDAGAGFGFRGNSRGIIVEFSNQVDIRVLNNNMHDNRLRGAGESPPSGLLIMGSRGILIQGNRTNHNGNYGIDFRSRSRDNRLFGNDFGSNPLAVHLTGDSGPNCGTGNLPNPFAAC